MHRPVLRLADAAGHDWPQVRFRHLPAAIRAAGFTPDSASLLPGDVILSRTDTHASRLIRQAQADARFDPEHAAWTHVALFLGGDMLLDGTRDPSKALVIEAQPGHGVRITGLADHAHGRDLLVRRDMSLGDDLAKRYAIAVAAIAQFGRPYAVGHAFLLGLRSWFGRRIPADARYPQRVICSNLVRNAYASAGGRDLLGSEAGDAWPADLSFSTALADVTIGWLKIA